MAGKIATRFLVISDTHGDDVQKLPKEPVDVVIHSGDLTEESKMDEFRQAIKQLTAIPAPLKLVIAGNHDFTLDETVFEQKLAGVKDCVDVSIIKREYGDFGDARALFDSEEAKAAGIVFLSEGNHTFELANGASLNVYASPYTPSINEWGFQYDPRHGHEWSIRNDTDVVITHGPPKGIFDRADGGRVGDADLFAAVARARPQMHCFGHIHNDWGAKKVAWRKEISEKPSHFTDINNDKSVVIETLAGIERRKFDTDEDAKNKEIKLAGYREEGCCTTGEQPYSGDETVFINAAIEGKDDASQHLPWLVVLGLGRRELNEVRHDDGSARSSAEAEINTQHHVKVAPVAELNDTGGEYKRKEEEQCGGRGDQYYL